MPQKKVVARAPMPAKKLFVTNPENNVVEFAVTRAHIMKNLLETVRYIVDDANLVFTKDSIKVTRCNDSQTVFIFVRLRTNEADHYWFDPNADEFVVGVDILKLHRVLKTINANDLLSIRVHRQNPKEFSVEAYSCGDSTFKSNFIFRPFESTSARIELPKLTYKTKLAINAARLQKAVRDLENLGVHFVQIQCVDNQLMIKSFQGGIVQQCTTFEGTKVSDDSEEDDSFGVSEAGPSELYSGVFHLKPLTYCTRSTALNETINIYLQNNIPLLLEYPVASFGYLRCLLFGATEDDSRVHD